MFKRKTKEELIEQRNEIRLAMSKAFSDDDMPEYGRLNEQLEKLNRKIERRKK